MLMSRVTPQAKGQMVHRKIDYVPWNISGLGQGGLDHETVKLCETVHGEILDLIDEQ